MPDGEMTKPLDVHAELAELAREIGRLRMDWHQPEPFYEQRSAIAGRLRALAGRLGTPPQQSRPPIVRTVVEIRTIERVSLAHLRRRSQRAHRYPLPPRSATPTLI
jgi:hypothetical protein